ncbi:hypothetical protein G3A56_15765 [Rhizobium oryzihabitans]|uniref:Lipoprotein with Yx(FWY)xxD motif n=2 Tax=Rhizobium oryzihabitans TaxID=2267833 RepID=A0A7L5BKJ6_9HYPH|nr:hypothetical protein G3A56_15765 [Rhizobium oryzihabitans]
MSLDVLAAEAARTKEDMSMKIRFIVPALVLAFAGTAYAAPAVETVKTEKGNVLAGEKGMTLYTFKNDKKGVSNCYDKCAVNWPPFFAATGDKAEGAYSVVTRKDGKMQWAKDGMPLYYWAKDMKKGDATGDGMNGVWDAAKP